MRRILLCLLCLNLLILPAGAVAGDKYVALTFDDGPSGRFTTQLLDGLQERKVKATFLLCGYRMEQFPDLTQRIFNEGHEIGYHGYSHNNMKEMSRRSIAQEIIDSQNLLPEDCEPVFLRPPGGCCSDGVRQVAEVRLLSILGWSVDPRDWATQDTISIQRAVTRNIRDGDIILLHDMSASSVMAALEIIDSLQKEGFRFVTVTQLAKLRGVRLKPGVTYNCFPPEDEK